MFIDIAFNATDDNQLDEVMQRAKDSNVLPIIVGLDIESSIKATLLAEKYDTFCYFGVHPLHYSPNDIKFENFTKFIGKRTIAIGECGLDFYRADNKQEQIELLNKHIELSKNYSNLPFFYHCRNAFQELSKIIINTKGVVHSFDGTFEEVNWLVNQGFFIGINGCSLKNESCEEVIRSIPLNRILLETDSPYCLIRKSYYASKYVEIKKSKKNEPSFILQIAEAVAKIKKVDLLELEKAVFENTLEVFPVLKEHFNKK